VWVTEKPIQIRVFLRENGLGGGRFCEYLLTPNNSYATPAEWCTILVFVFLTLVILFISKLEDVFYFPPIKKNILLVA
jgi:magnesium-transporting ATPase (P-type)